MTTTTQITGAILIAVGVIAYIATGLASATALIPAAVGVVILILGLVARRAGAHQHAIHAALVVALLGALAHIMPLTGIAEPTGASIAALLTILVCVVYLIMGVRSFIAARRAREAAGG